MDATQTSHTGEDESLKKSEWPAETITRPQKPNDAGEVIKKGLWKWLSFSLWQTCWTAAGWQERLCSLPSTEGFEDHAGLYKYLYCCVCAASIKPVCLHMILCWRLLTTSQKWNILVCVLERYDLNQRAAARTRTELTNPLLWKSILTKVKQSRNGKCRSARQ